MPSSRGDALSLPVPTDRLCELADAYAAAAKAFAASDLDQVTRCIDRAAELLAEPAGPVDDAAALERAQTQHARLLAAVTSECERARCEIARVRIGRRALGIYGARHALPADIYDA